jgi:hypothetical protein
MAKVVKMANGQTDTDCQIFHLKLPDGEDAQSHQKHEGSAGKDGFTAAPVASVIKRFTPLMKRLDV